MAARECGTRFVAGNPNRRNADADPPHRPGSPALDADRASLLSEFGVDDD